MVAAKTVVAKLILWFYPNKHGSKILGWFQQKSNMMVANWYAGSSKTQPW